MIKVVDLLERRRARWQEFEQLCAKLERRPRSVSAFGRLRFAALYRSACADLALADAYQLPPGTIRYLHHLVARGHNQLYRSRAFNIGAWWRELTINVPGRLLRDRALWLAAAVFWGIFVASAGLAARSPEFAEEVATREMLEQVQDMYSQPLDRTDPNMSGLMSGFYIFHNAGIGLQCFAGGLILGVGGLFVTVSNASQLGAIFGHMATVPERTNFYQFVTAHGPFELTAIVLSAAAGMRMGFSLIDTRGRDRVDSLRAAAVEAVPSISAAIILFCLAAGIEAFISPSTLPYLVKAAVAIMSTLILLFYFVVLGWWAGAPRGT